MGTKEVKDETEYLLSSKENKKRLLESIKQIERSNQTVTSQEKLKEIREMIKYILPTPDCNDSEIVETYTETIMSIFSQDKTVISNSEIEEYFDEKYAVRGGGYLFHKPSFLKGAKLMRSKLSTTVTELKE